jgi:putative heme iron utilization protein
VYKFDDTHVYIFAIGGHYDSLEPSSSTARRMLPSRPRQRRLGSMRSGLCTCVRPAWA